MPSRKRGREDAFFDQYVASSSAALLPIPGMQRAAVAQHHSPAPAAVAARMADSSATASTSGRAAAAAASSADALLAELYRQGAAEVDAVVRAECERLRAGLEQLRKQRGARGAAPAGGRREPGVVRPGAQQRGRRHGAPRRARHPPPPRRRCRSCPGTACRGGLRRLWRRPRRRGGGRRGVPLLRGGRGRRRGRGRVVPCGEQVAVQGVRRRRGVGAAAAVPRVGWVCTLQIGRGTRELGAPDHHRGTGGVGEDLQG